MNRAPNLAFLWLGGIIMGAHEEIMQVCRFGLMTIDLHAAVWSGTTPIIHARTCLQAPEDSMQFF